MQDHHKKSIKFINLFSNQSRTKRAVVELAQFFNHVYLEFCIRSNVKDDDFFISVPNVHNKKTLLASTKQ